LNNDQRVASGKPVKKPVNRNKIEESKREVILKKISPESWNGADSEMRIIPEGKIVISVVVSYRSKKIVIHDAHKKHQHTKKGKKVIWQIFIAKLKTHALVL
jgi:hypothetical protein